MRDKLVLTPKERKDYLARFGGVNAVNDRVVFLANDEKAATATSHLKIFERRR